MVKKEARVFQIYRILFKQFGPQHWWPAKTPFEVVVGAILTQNTNWGNVEKAIGELKKHKLLNPKKIIESRASSVERRIRCSGYFRQKTRKLKAFSRHLCKYHHGSLKHMFRQGMKALRDELLSIHGIGNETADSIILYAANKSSFVVDAYTRRIGHRLGLFKFSDYGTVKRYFEDHLPRSVKIYNEYHALLVKSAKSVCRKKPLCRECVLRSICPKLGV